MITLSCPRWYSHDTTSGNEGCHDHGRCDAGAPCITLGPTWYSKDADRRLLQVLHHEILHHVLYRLEGGEVSPTWAIDFIAPGAGDVERWLGLEEPCASRPEERPALLLPLLFQFADTLLQRVKSLQNVVHARVEPARCDRRHATHSVARVRLARGPKNPRAYVHHRFAWNLTARAAHLVLSCARRARSHLHAAAERAGPDAPVLALWGFSIGFGALAAALLFARPGWCP